MKALTETSYSNLHFNKEFNFLEEICLKVDIYYAREKKIWKKNGHI